MNHPPMSDPSQSSYDAPPARTARIVPPTRALAWYVEAMRLWRRGPLTFMALAFVTVAADFVLSLIPTVGVVVAQVIVPLVAAGLLFASLSADRGGRPRFADIAGIAGASGAAITAVIAAGVVVFAAEALTGLAIANVDLLSPGTNDASLNPGTMLVIYTIGIAVSLPFTFVPFAALFDRLPFRAAFAQSFDAFTRNPAAFTIYGFISLALLLFGWATFGLGLLFAVPLWAASSYAAWKDIFGIPAHATTTPP